MEARYGGLRHLFKSEEIDGADPPARRPTAVCLEEKSRVKVF
jgi:hypothetical protein